MDTIISTHTAVWKALLKLRHLQRMFLFYLKQGRKPRRSIQILHGMRRDTKGKLIGWGLTGSVPKHYLNLHFISALMLALVKGVLRLILVKFSSTFGQMEKLESALTSWSSGLPGKCYSGWQVLATLCSFISTSSLLLPSSERWEGPAPLLCARKA